MAGNYVIENGLLTFKPFIGPLQQVVIEPKRVSSIAKTLEGYENVSDNVLMHNNLKEQQAAVTSTLETQSTNANIEKINRPKVIRKRRKFVYNAADEIIEKGYWIREKRSLTKLASNSLMFEFTQVRAGYKQI